MIIFYNKDNGIIEATLNGDKLGKFKPNNNQKILIVDDKAIDPPTYNYRIVSEELIKKPKEEIQKRISDEKKTRNSIVTFKKSLSKDILNKDKTLSERFDSLVKYLNIKEKVN